jgi:hypothetical protein
MSEKVIHKYLSLSNTYVENADRYTMVVQTLCGYEETIKVDMISGLWSDESLVTFNIEDTTCTQCQEHYGISLLRSLQHV